MDPSLVRGLWLMALAIACLSCMDAAVKLLLLSGVHTVTLLAVRSLIITTVILLTLRYTGALHKLRSKRLRAHGARALVGLMAVGCFFSSLNYLPLADAVVVFLRVPYLSPSLQSWY